MARITTDAITKCFDTIILASVLYAAPAWRGYLNAGDIDSLQQLFVNAKRWQIVSDNYDVYILNI